MSTNNLPRTNRNVVLTTLGILMLILVLIAFFRRRNS